jgi:hypothetical protein
MNAIDTIIAAMLATSALEVAAIPAMATPAALPVAEPKAPKAPKAPSEGKAKGRKGGIAPEDERCARQEAERNACNRRTFSAYHPLIRGNQFDGAVKDDGVVFGAAGINDALDKCIASAMAEGRAARLAATELALTAMAAKQAFLTFKKSGDAENTAKAGKDWMLAAGAAAVKMAIVKAILAEVRGENVAKLFERFQARGENSRDVVETVIAKTCVPDVKFSDEPEVVEKREKRRMLAEWASAQRALATEKRDADNAAAALAASKLAHGIADADEEIPVAVELPEVKAARQARIALAAAAAAAKAAIPVTAESLEAERVARLARKAARKAIG